MPRLDRTFTLAVLGLVVTAVSAQAQPINDHLKCYQFKDTLKLAGIADLNTPAFGLDPGCKLSKAKFFCVPGTKTVFQATDNKVPITLLPVSGPEAAARVCYKVKCPTASIPDQQLTDQFGVRTGSKFKTSFLCTPAYRGSGRFILPGDGTVIDNYTGLQWEFKNSAGGGPDYGNPHDIDNTYTWGTGGDAAAGTAFTDFLSALNACRSSNNGEAVPVFGGHCDWRLPTIAELRGLHDNTVVGCDPGPCIDPGFGPTNAGVYWSSTTIDPSTFDAWGWQFHTSFGGGGGAKTTALYVIAVRGDSRQLP